MFSRAPQSRESSWVFREDVQELSLVFREDVKVSRPVETYRTRLHFVSDLKSCY